MRKYLESVLGESNNLKYGYKIGAQYDIFKNYFHSGDIAFMADSKDKARAKKRADEMKRKTTRNAVIVVNRKGKTKIKKKRNGSR